MLGTRRAGIFTALGVSTGQLVWTFAASIGIAALLVASEPAFQALKLVGAAYLIWLGVQTLWSVVRRRSRGASFGAPPRGLAAPGLAPGRAEQSRQPEVGGVLHEPAAAVRRLVRGPARPRAALLGADAHWLSGYAVAVARAGEVLRRERVRRALDAVTGAVLVAFGIRLATERR